MQIPANLLATICTARVSSKYDTDSSDRTQLQSRGLCKEELVVFDNISCSSGSDLNPKHC